jgi:hypothetical protein
MSTWDFALGVKTTEVWNCPLPPEDKHEWAFPLCPNISMALRLVNKWHNCDRFKEHATLQRDHYTIFIISRKSLISVFLYNMLLELRVHYHCLLNSFDIYTSKHHIIITKINSWYLSTIRDTLPRIVGQIYPF